MRDVMIRRHDLKPETVRALEAMKEEIRQEDFREGLRDVVREALPAVVSAIQRAPAAPLDRSLTPLEQLAQNFDHAELALRQLATFTSEDFDKGLLASRIASEMDEGGRWTGKWLLEPLDRVSRFHQARAELETATERERASFIAIGKGLEEARGKYAALLVGNPARAAFEKRIERTEIERERCRADVAALEQRLARTPLIENAKVGLGRYLEVVLRLYGSQVTEALQTQGQSISRQATELLGVLAYHQRTVARAEAEVGKPLKVPRLTTPVRKEMEAIAKSPFSLVEEEPAS